MRRALVIVGKAPRPGRTKTRLVPPLSPADAADLARAFLLDTLETGLSLGWEQVTVVHPDERDEAHLLAALVPAGVDLSAQVGRGLGDALRGAFADHFARGFERVVLIDSDSPTVPARILAEACSALDTADVSIGPCVDGGYYLLGLQQQTDGLFENIPWSTAHVFEDTLERARGLRVHVLPEWYDVDSAGDLARLRADLLEQPAQVAPHTRKALFQGIFRTAATHFGGTSGQSA